VLEPQHDRIQLGLAEPVTRPSGPLGARQLVFVLKVRPTERPEHRLQVSEQARSVRVEMKKVLNRSRVCMPL
jgi:hypothetical protein